MRQIQKSSSLEVWFHLDSKVVFYVYLKALKVSEKSSDTYVLDTVLKTISKPSTIYEKKSG